MVRPSDERCPEPAVGRMETESLETSRLFMAIS